MSRPYFTAVEVACNATARKSGYVYAKLIVPVLGVGMNAATSLSLYFEAAQTGALKRDKRDLSVPIDFLNDLNGTKTRNDILSVYSVWAQRLVQADRCSIALSDKAGGLIITAMNGRRGIPQGTRHTVSDTVIGEVFVRRQPLFLPDVSQIDMPDAHLVQKLGYSSAVIVPILTGAHCFGALSASFKSALQYPQPTLAMLEAMGRCLATQLLVIEQMENLALMAQTDALTGAFNRHHLYAKLNDMWAEWQTKGMAFSFLTLDLDHFKRINDTHGHDTGDAVLTCLVQRLRTKTRAKDDVIRMGGEEFGVLMRNTDERIAARRGQRLRRAITDEPFSVCDVILPITASFGICQVSCADAGPEAVLKRADAALYAAKERGRDQITIARKDELVSA